MKEKNFKSIFNNHSMIIKENFENFSDHEHETWRILFKRQMEILKNRATEEILEGLEKLKICDNKIPKFCQINEILQKETDFEIIPVSGYIPGDLFFKFLSQRKFPAVCFIRKREELDYAETPDMFHDLFGHVPLLSNKVFADFMQAFGEKALQAIDLGLSDFASKLYLFTIEFGLIKSKSGLKIYGAGIMSSKTESIYCLESEIPKRIKYNVLRIIKTSYVSIKLDVLQTTYFVIENFNELFKSLELLDWQNLKSFLNSFPDIDSGININKNEIVII